MKNKYLMNLRELLELQDNELAKLRDHVRFLELTVIRLDSIKNGNGRNANY